MKGQWNLKWECLALAAAYLATSGTLMAQPANDNFADRIHLSGTRVTTSGTTTGATRETEEPPIVYRNSPVYPHTVWWSWTAPADGLLAVNFHGAPDNTLIRIYTGTNLSELRLVGYCLGFSGCSAVRADVSAEVAYAIVVASYPNVTADIIMDLAFVERPLNDDFVNRIHLGSGNISVTATNTAGTREAGESEAGILMPKRTLWWSWTAPTDGPVTVGLEPGLFNPDASAFDDYLGGSVWISIVAGDSLATSVLVATRVVDYFSPLFPPRAQVTFEAKAGTTYQIATDGYLPLFRPFILSIVKTAPPFVLLTRPGDDAEFIAGDSVSVGAEVFDPDGKVEAVEFYLEEEFGAGSRVRRDEELPFGGQWSAVPAGRYRLFARAFDQLGMTADAFPVLLNVRPLNDAFARRIAVTGASITVTGTLHNASFEPGEPPLAGHGSVWWEWTAPASGRFTIRSSSAPLAVYSSGSLSNLTLLALSEFDGYGTNFVAQIAIEAEAGAVYPIAVGTRSNNGGFYSLSVTKTEPPTVAITSPLPESRLIVGEPVTFAATASDPDGSVRRVDFVLNDFEVLGTVTNSPFSFVQTFTQGYVRHRVRAWVTDDAGITTGSDTVWFEVHYPGPTNDHFADRISFAGSFVSVTGSTANATYEPGEDEWVRNGSVWWEWTAPESGPFTISVRSDYWPSLAIFTGGNLVGLQLVTNSAFVGRDYSYETTVVIDAVAGVAYPIAAASGGDVVLNVARTLPPVVRIVTPTNNSVYVVGQTISLVAEATDPDGTIASVEFYDYESQRLGVVTNSPFVLAFETAQESASHRIQAWATDNHGVRSISDEVWFLVRLPGPTNDQFADRITLNGSFVSITGATANATFETDEAILGNHGSVWWSWIAPESADFTVSVTSMPGYWPWMAVYSGSTFGSLTLITNNSYVGGDSTYSTRAVLRAEADFDYAIAAGSGSDVTLSIVQNVPPTVTLTSPEPGAIFFTEQPVTFVASASDADGSVRRVEFVLDGYLSLGVATNSPFSMAHTFSDGSAEHRIRAIATDDTGLVTISEPIWFRVQTRTLPPPNDDFANRMRLSGTLVVADGTLIGATRETGEAIPGTLPEAGTVWWSWAAPASGWVTLIISGESLFVGAFIGSTVTSLVAIASNTIDARGNSPNRVEFEAVAGTEYQFVAARRDYYPTSIQLTLFFDARELRQPRMLRDGLFALDLHSTVERLWIIEASTNLIHWTPVAAGQCADGTLEFLDPTAVAHPVRFYRAVDEPRAPEIW